MMKAIRLAGILAIAALAMTGCSDSNDTVNPPQQPGTSEAAFEAIAELVNPALSAMNVPDFLGLGAPAAAVAGGGTVCNNRAGICSQGTVQFCEDVNLLDVSYSSCVIGSDTIGGSLSIAGDNSSGTASYSLTANGSSFSGGLSYTVSGSCADETISSITMTASAGSADLGGALNFCAGQTYPTGTVSLTTSGGVGAYSISMTYNGTSTAQASVTESGTTDSFPCSLDIVTSEATCSPAE